MLEPVKVAFGQYMGRFYAGIQATTLPLKRYITRGLARSIVWAPSRMVDAAEEMHDQWLRAERDGVATRPQDLPVIIVAMARDYTPTGRDYTHQVADPQWVMLPDDPKERRFKLRTIAGDIRIQIAIFASDEPSARSLAAQWLLFVDSTDNRRFMAEQTFAGIKTRWPVQIESPEAPVMSIASEAKNLTILAVDLTLHASLPLFDAPAPGDPNDGKGIPGTDDPAGYPLVAHLPITDLPPDSPLP